jgi:hypothetical protein
MFTGMSIFKRSLKNTLAESAFICKPLIPTLIVLANH